MDAPALVTVRFRTARAGLCGCHISGVNYDLPADFARQVVERERVADYVPVEAAPTAAQPMRKPRR